MGDDCTGEKSINVIINMTDRCRVKFDMIHTEREGYEDRQADRDTVRAAAGRENYGPGAGGTVRGIEKDNQQGY